MNQVEAEVVQAKQAEREAARVKVREEIAEEAGDDAIAGEQNDGDNVEMEDSYKESTEGIYACQDCPFHALTEEEGKQHKMEYVYQREDGSWWHHGVEEENILDLTCLVCGHQNEDKYERE